MTEIPNEQMSESSAEQTSNEQKQPDKQSNIVFVGKKPSMAYVLATVTQFSDGQESVHIKARGHSISKAVDIAEIVRNKFVLNAKADDITIGTDKIKAEDGKDINVSTIDIVLRK